MHETKTLTLFPMILLRSTVSQNASQRTQLLETLDRVRRETPNSPPPQWSCPVYSTMKSNSSLQRLEEVAVIVDQVVSEAKVLAAKKSVTASYSDKLAVTQAWLTVLTRGQSVDVHTQSNSLYTALYFPEAPEDGACLTLHNAANERGLSVPVRRETPLNQEYFVCRPGVDELLVFESHIAQSFMVHESDCPQLCLTFTLAAR